MVFGFWVKIILNLNFTLLYKKWNGVENAAVFNLLTPRSNCNFPYCQPYNSYNDSSENLVLDQLLIPKLIFFFILITYLELVLGNDLYWSSMKAASYHSRERKQSKVIF